MKKNTDTRFKLRKRGENDPLVLSQNKRSLAGHEIVRLEFERADVDALRKNRTGALRNSVCSILTWAWREIHRRGIRLIEKQDGAILEEKQAAYPRIVGGAKSKTPLHVMQVPLTPALLAELEEAGVSRQRACRILCKWGTEELQRLGKTLEDTQPENP